MGWFVQPDMVTLTLENGNYLQVKKRLTSKEARKVFSGIVKTMIPGEKIELDPEQVGVTKVIAYVIGWGGPDLVDQGGLRWRGRACCAVLGSGARQRLAGRLRADRESD